MAPVHVISGSFFPMLLTFFPALSEPSANGRTTVEADRDKRILLNLAAVSLIIGANLLTFWGHHTGTLIFPWDFVSSAGTATRRRETGDRIRAAADDDVPHRLATRARHGEERERWMAIIAERALMGWVNEWFVPPACPRGGSSKGGKREKW